VHIGRLVLELQADPAARSTATLEKLLQFTCLAHRILCFFYHIGK